MNLFLKIFFFVFCVNVIDCKSFSPRQNFSGIESSCHWKSLDCFVHCKDAISSQITDEINVLLIENEDCFQRTRVLINNITFPRNVMRNNWFLASTYVVILEMQDDNIIDILPNAFVSPAFAKLRDLTLKGFRVQFLRNGIFNGLPLLERIEIRSFDLQRFESNIFGMLNNLVSLMLIDCVKYSVLLDGATGTEFLEKLNIVAVVDSNIGSTITKRTFHGLVSIASLFLRNSRITVIGERSFDAISQTINHLDLSGNLLKTISPHLFDPLLTKYDLIFKQIRLNDNPWHCDCALAQLKQQTIKFYSAFKFSAVCNTPIALHNVSISAADLCVGQQTPSIDHSTISITTAKVSKTTSGMPTTSTIYKTEPVETTTPVTLPGHHFVKLKCSKFNLATLANAFLQKQDKFIRLRQTFKKKLTISIKEFPADHVVIWFENDLTDTISTSNSINCISNSIGKRTQNIVLRPKVEANKLYRFCMMKKDTAEITPLNCVSFNTFERNKYESEMWLSKRNSLMTIVALIGAYLISILFGIFLVYMLIRRYPILFGKYFKINLQNVDAEPKKLMQKKQIQVEHRKDESVRKFPSYQNQCNEIQSNCISDSQFDYVCWKVQREKCTSDNTYITPLEIDKTPPLPPPHRMHLQRQPKCDTSQAARK